MEGLIPKCVGKPWEIFCQDKKALDIPKSGIVFTNWRLLWSGIIPKRKIWLLEIDNTERMRCWMKVRDWTWLVDLVVVKREIDHVDDGNETVDFVDEFWFFMLIA